MYGYEVVPSLVLVLETLGVSNIKIMRSNIIAANRVYDVTSLLSKRKIDENMDKEDGRRSSPCRGFLSDLFSVSWRAFQLRDFIASGIPERS
mmetsp:Transcript_5276/g.15326  ORF Transcript_5276/g.15326 Transcript_5276/m.15326 type:complete len:92 (-) Transcript_5276:296-571(-)